MKQNDRPFGRIETVVLDKVSRRYGSVAAVENLSLEISGSKLICLVGVYVIQSIGLFPHMTVGENIGLILRREGWDEEHIKARVSKLLELIAPPETFLSRYPREFSEGRSALSGRSRASLGCSSGGCCTLRSIHLPLLHWNCPADGRPFHSQPLNVRGESAVRQATMVVSAAGP